MYTSVSCSPFRIFRRSLPLVLVTLLGCGKEAVREQRTTATESKPPAKSSLREDAPLQTPEATFAAILQACEKKDWKSAATMLTPESQARMAGSLVGGAHVSAAGDERKGRELNDLLHRYGVDLFKATAGPPPATSGEAMAELFKPVDDLPAFIGDVAVWLEKNGGEESHGGLAEMQSIEELKLEGDAARAFVQTDHGRFPVEFHKTGGGWRLRFADDLPAESRTPEREHTRPEQANPVAPFALVRSFEVEDFDSVQAMAFSLDGKFLVTGAEAPRVWNVDTPQQQGELDELNRTLARIDACEAIAFSADGTSLALGAGDGSVTLLDMSSKARKHVFNLHSNGIVSLAFSPDGKRLLTSSYDGTVKFVNAETGDVISDMDTGDGRAVHAVLMPEGNKVISVGREVLIWDNASAEKSRGFDLGKPRQWRVDAVAISPGGKLLATAEFSRDFRPAVHLWSIATQELVATLTHRFNVMTVAFSPDGTLLATAGIDSAAHIWRVADGERIQTIEETERRSIEGVAWGPSGRLAIDCYGLVRIWDKSEANE